MSRGLGTALTLSAWSTARQSRRSVFSAWPGSSTRPSRRRHALYVDLVHPVVATSDRHEAAARRGAGAPVAGTPRRGGAARRACPRRRGGPMPRPLDRCHRRERLRRRRGRRPRCLRHRPRPTRRRRPVAPRSPATIAGSAAVIDRHAIDGAPAPPSARRRPRPSADAPLRDHAPAPRRMRLAGSVARAGRIAAIE